MQKKELKGTLRLVQFVIRRFESVVKVRPTKCTLLIVCSLWSPLFFLLILLERPRVLRAQHFYEV